MKQLWETDMNNPTNCQVCGNDTPYYMPARHEGIINLTFKYDDFIFNPAAGIDLNPTIERVAMDGTTLIEDLGGGGTAFNQKSIVGYDSVNQKYDIFIPSPCGLGSDEFASRYQCTVLTGNIGDQASIFIDTLNGGIYQKHYTFIIGEEVPPPLYLMSYSGGTATYMVNSRYQGLIIDPTIVPNLALVTLLTVPNKDVEIPCHRYKLSFSNGSTDYEFLSVPFECPPCDEDVITISNKNPLNFVDCCGSINSESLATVGGGSPETTQTNNRLSVYGYSKYQAPKMELEYASNCYHSKSRKIDRSIVQGRPMPYWLSDAMACVISGSKLYVEGEEHLLDGDTFIEENDVELTESQYLNLSLQKCKCEKSFFC